MRIVFALIMSMLIAAAGSAQQNQASQDKPSDKTKPAATKEKKDKRNRRHLVLRTKRLILPANLRSLPNLTPMKPPTKKNTTT